MVMHTLIYGATSYHHHRNSSVQLLQYTIIVHSIAVVCMYAYVRVYILVLYLECIVATPYYHHTHSTVTLLYYIIIIHMYTYQCSTSSVSLLHHTIIIHSHSTETLLYYIIIIHMYTYQYSTSSVSLLHPIIIILTLVYRCYTTPLSYTLQCNVAVLYGVATISRLLKIIGLFCRIQSF